MIGALVAIGLSVAGQHLVIGATDGKAGQPDLDRLAKEHGREITRQISYDLCFPATRAEYLALGKNAIVRLEASSMMPTELPLRSVYVQHGGARTQLVQIATFDPYVDATRHRTVQVSFYLLPTRLRRLNGKFEADFVGRDGFVIDTFAASQNFGPGAPTFLRRDPHDTPGKVDPAAVIAVMKREYPDDMR